MPPTPDSAPAPDPADDEAAAAAAELDAAIRPAIEHRRFIEALDLIARGRDATLRVAGVIPAGKELDGAKRPIRKPILAFDRTDRRLILNKTAIDTLVLMFGSRASAWVGKSITLTVRLIDDAYGQDNLPVVRIVLPTNPPAPYSLRKRFGRPLNPQDPPAA
jgi:hypothetical protein